jgi:hypothetical protein
MRRFFYLLSLKRYLLVSLAVISWLLITGRLFLDKEAKQLCVLVIGERSYNYE